MGKSYKVSQNAKTGRILITMIGRKTMLYYRYLHNKSVFFAIATAIFLSGIFLCLLFTFLKLIFW